jgi:hypothetical protein
VRDPPLSALSWLPDHSLAIRFATICASIPTSALKLGKWRVQPIKPSFSFKCVTEVFPCIDPYFISVFPKAVLGGISLNSPEYHTSDCQLTLEAFGIFRHVDRIARGLGLLCCQQSLLIDPAIAIVEVAIVRKYGRQVKDGTEL